MERPAARSFFLDAALRALSRVAHRGRHRVCKAPAERSIRRPSLHRSRPHRSCAELTGPAPKPNPRATYGAAQLTLAERRRPDPGRAHHPKLPEMTISRLPAPDRQLDNALR